MHATGNSVPGGRLPLAELCAALFWAVPFRFPSWNDLGLLEKVFEGDVAADVADIEARQGWAV